MDNVDKTRQLFLIGTGILVVLIIAGLIWAIASGPIERPGDGGAQVKSNVVFNDAGNPAIGPVDAKVTVRIFSDFQCPACRIAEAPLRAVMEGYKDRVRFVWNDFPLASIHANATVAAVSARCADSQGKFWEFSDKLFGSQDQWSDLASPNAYFEGLATSLGIQKESFSACLASDSARQKVLQDVQEADAMGLNSTPTFIVDRTVYSGVMDQTEWAKILDTVLAK